ncbi:MAG TPA: PHB depolymerase family esterase [Candidatus Sulfotelmatobacter sp.]|nr:PHB depolymerase family esterase [Candidatus Sulfotelmatobacter sp.]
MMLRIFSILAVVAAGLLYGCPGALASTMEFDGLQRSFEMAVPPTAPRPLPVILVLHGGGGTSSQIRAYSHFDDVAQSQGALVVYPQAVGRHWNDGRLVPGILPHAVETDDVAFLMALVDSLAGTGLADPHRVYVAGIANGGMMALRLACELSERISGIAVVAANMPVGIDCAPSRPVPAVFFHGTQDRFIPWDGGYVLQWANIDRGKVESVADTLALWRKIDGCSGEISRDVVSKSGSLVSRRITSARCQGASVEHYVTDGGGHVWPGARQGPGGDALLGAVDRDLDATAVIWSFFKAQPGR